MNKEMLIEEFRGQSTFLPRTPMLPRADFYTSRQLGTTGSYKSLRVNSVAPPTNREPMFPELMLANAPPNMHFGNYSCRQYGLAVPRMANLSLYEKLFLKEHLAKDNIRVKVVPQESYRWNKHVKAGMPSLSHYLYSKKRLYNVDKPIILEVENRFGSRSERERYKKANVEFSMLREKLVAEPDKAQLIALAVNSTLISSL
eukprot:TRINITY_DN2090_c0_g1_i4.p1 TRINITY_DN2090_c0_g1~~TRINITY_DN2090_c0_g1_i4.p1  ORF type:complete len:201 (-),score=38.72 TRINITY_DN2090_c0_g1_i4:649-1251(-)